METNALDSILAQLRAAQAAMRPNEAAQQTVQPGKGEPGSFSQVLRDAVDSVNDTQMKSSDMQKAFEMGDPDIDLQDVMVQMAKANISFQTMIQVRNRIISAYQDVMNMPV